MPSRLTVVLVSLLLATPAVILWLWLVIVTARWAILCPEKCMCVGGGINVDCKGAGLNSIPSILPTNVRTLTLDNNSITFFENDSFVSRGLVELEILRADFCKLRKIDFGAFNGITKLTHISINGNELSEIIPGTFGKIRSLESLGLSHNIIEHLGSDVFNGLVNLGRICLIGNKLHYLHPDTFVGLPNLRLLDLSENPGLQTPNDRHFINSHSLKELYISHCNVSSVSVETFAKVSALEQLDLSYNYLRSLDINILRALPELNQLILHSNEISQIIPGIFENSSRLNFLDLNYNIIKHLEFEVFNGLVNLRYIHLEGNKLQYLHPDTFAGLANLKRLFLSENSGLQLPTDRHFINSDSLKRLGISGCNVSSVSVETFAKVSALKWLDLSGNNLSSVDINILTALPKLSAIYLYGNPLHCDCQLQKVWRWCQENNIEIECDGEAPECDTPIEVKGLSWGELEKVQCLEGYDYYYEDYKNTKYSYTSIDDMITGIKKKPDTKNLVEENVFLFVKPYEFPVSAFFFIFGTIGNVIIIIIIVRNKEMRTVSNMYILSLAVSDVIYLTVLFFEASAIRFPDMWLYAGISCAFIPFCYRMSVGLSAYTITVLNLQRCRVIAKTLHVRFSAQPTWRAPGATICGVWIVAALFAIPAALSKYICVQSIMLLPSNYVLHVVIFQLLMSCVLPLCVIALSYTLKARHIVKSSCHVLEQKQNPQLNTSKNTAEVVYTLSLVFIISYLPYHICETYFYSRIYLDIDHLFYGNLSILRLSEINPILKFFLSMNSCLNPVALFCTSPAFRRHLKRYLNYFCKTKFPPADFELTRRN